jgi:hypothetical protein
MARSFECKSGLGLQNTSWVTSFLRERIFFWVENNNMFMYVRSHLIVSVPAVQI